jgi:hypothetical protein
MVRVMSFKVVAAAIALLLTLSAVVFAQDQTRKSVFLFPITLPDKGTGFIDQTGRVVIEPRFVGSMYGIRFSEGLAPVLVDKRNTGWGYIDAKGKIVFTVPEARWAGDFTEGLAGVAFAAKATDSDEEKLKWGFIDKTGKMIIKPQFDEQYGFSEGMGRVVVNGFWGVIDRTGKFVIEPQFKSILYFSEGFASVTLANDQRVFIDHSGQIASPGKYTFTASWFSEGLIEFYSENKCGFMNTHWQVVIEPKFDECGQIFSDGIAAVRVGDRWGVIDKLGKFVIEPKYERRLSFHEGLAVMFIDGKYGYIDKSGAVVIEPQFLEAGDFRGGLAAVTRDPGVKTVQCCWRYWDYIDKSGKFVWQSPKE